MPGIHTVDDLKARCRVESESGCWIWAGPYCGRGVPLLWLPRPVGKTSLTQMLHRLLRLPKPTHKALLMPVCGNFACANPTHRRMGTKGEFLRDVKFVRHEAPQVPARLLPEYPAWMVGGVRA